MPLNGGFITIREHRLVIHRYFEQRMGFLEFDGNENAVWSVTELTAYIKELFEIDFRLRDIEVVGEISNFTRARSGHLYFTLKDSDAQLRCAMWRSSAQRLRFDPQDGDAVLVHGRISVYEASGVYQLYADRMEPEGLGDLALAFEQLKQKLAAEGLFDPERKQAVPVLPRKIGLVTSADAAALRDILNVLHRRAPLVSVLLAPTLVQGNEAPRQIVRALRWLDGRDDIDVIIVARGGGSIEDLWAFNDEDVARAIAAVNHPVISGVGHETDFTIADFVADLRAPTPSAAAELAVPDLSYLPENLAQSLARLAAAVSDRIEELGWHLQTHKQALLLASPRATLDNQLQKVDVLTMRLEQSMSRRLERAEAAVTLRKSRLDAINPQAILQRGYAIVRRQDGTLIRSRGQVKPGIKLDIQVADGSFEATAE